MKGCVLSCQLPAGSSCHTCPIRQPLHELVSPVHCRAPSGRLGARLFHCLHLTRIYLASFLQGWPDWLHGAGQACMEHNLWSVTPALCSLLLVGLLSALDLTIDGDVHGGQRRHGLFWL